MTGPRRGGAGRLAALRPRRWSIGLRTGVTFGVVFAVLAALLLLAVGVATSRGVVLTLAVAPSGATSPGVAALPLEPSTGADAPRGDGLSTARVVGTVVARQQLIWSSVGVVLASAVAGGVGWFVSRRLLRPLDEIVATTRRISASTLHERIGLDGPRDELSRVASTIDDLLDRLEASFRAQRRFVADASHELRTPLAVQRAAIQIGLDDPGPGELERVRDQLLDANRRSERLIESLLSLATADRGLPDGVRRVEVADLVDEAVGGALAAADARDVEVVVARGTFRAVDGDPVLVGQLVRNLVDNAVEYADHGGCVRVHATPDELLVVQNTGAEIPQAVVATLLQPFTRVDRHPASTAADGGGGASSARHSGLGLTIVDSIARAHGWGVELEPGREGGLRVAVVPARR